MGTILTTCLFFALVELVITEPRESAEFATGSAHGRARAAETRRCWRASRRASLAMEPYK